MSLTKEKVEQIPLGQLTIHVSQADAWISEFPDLLEDAVTLSLEKAAEITGMNYSSLRAIIVTLDFADEVAEWQEKLYGYREGVTETPVSETGGKTLSWVSFDSFYTVVILSSLVGASLANKEPLAYGILIHELVHVTLDHNDFIAFGEEKSPYLDDWPSLKSHLSRYIFNEFVAEALSYPYSYEPLESSIKLSQNLLTFTVDQIQNKISVYRVNKDLEYLWRECTRALSILFQQFGRTLGCLSAANVAGANRFDEFIDLINTFSLSWGGFINNLLAAIRLYCESETFPIKEFTQICMVVDNGFNLVGLYPKITKMGLYVDVP